MPNQPDLRVAKNGKQRDMREILGMSSMLIPKQLVTNDFGNGLQAVHIGKQTKLASSRVSIHKRTDQENLPDPLIALARRVTALRLLVRTSVGPLESSVDEYDRLGVLSRLITWR
jgi:hypothetical protein